MRERASEYLGVSGTAIVIIREDLIGNALPQTPKLLNYEVFDKQDSLPNTINVFGVYVMSLVLEWIKNMAELYKWKKCRK